MRSLAVLCALAALCGVAAVAALAADGSRGEPAPAAFRLADGSAGCAYAEGRLACRAAGAESATVLERDGTRSRAEVVVAWDEETPVLLPAESWWHAGFACRVRAGGAIACSAS